MEITAKIFKVLGVYLIPVCVGFISLFSNAFSKMFVRENHTYQQISHNINYILVGQGVLICPLAVLVNIVKNTMVGQQITHTFVFALALYLAIYLASLAYYLRMSADEFENSAGPFVRAFYKGSPLVWILASVIVELLNM